MRTAAKLGRRKKLPKPRNAEELCKYVWADNLLAARLERRLSQEELSFRSGLDQATISRLENGDANFTTNHCIRLAVGLDAQVDDVFDWPPNLAAMANFERGAA